MSAYKYYSELEGKYGVLAGNCGKDVKFKFFEEDGGLTLMNTLDVEYTGKEAEGGLLESGYGWRFDREVLELWSSPWKYDNANLEAVNLHNIKSIFDGAFCESNISTIDLTGCKIIGAYAFRNCHDLKTVTGAEGIKYIGEGAFEGCENLEEIKGLDFSKLGVILNRTFNGCKKLFKSLSLHDIRYVGNYAFANCGIRELKFDNKMRNIGKRAFTRCWSKKVIIPDSVEFIGEGAFMDAEADVLHIGKGVKIIGDEAFSQMYVRRDFQNKSNARIGYGAFEFSDEDEVDDGVLPTEYDIRNEENRTSWE